MTTLETRNKGEELVRLSRSISTNLLTPTLDASDVLSQIKFSVDDWDFFVTVAGIRLGLLCLPTSEIDQETFALLYRQVVNELEITDKEMISALEDLTQYLNSCEKEDIILGIGMWIVMNLKHSNEINNSEVTLSQQLSQILLGNFGEWW